MSRESARKFGEPSLNGIIRRVVALPQKIIGEVSRVVDHEIDILRNIGRRNNQNLQQPFPLQPPSDQSSQIQEQWAFLATFEQQYGSFHPFFYASSFGSALKIAKDDNKFMFMYLHDALDHQHTYTSSFCTDTLCSEFVVEFLDANFVSWGGVVNRGDGLKMAATFRPASFPFCALIAPTPDDDLTVLQQMEGPMSAAELVEILQRTLEEQGSAFGVSSKTNYNQESERTKADQRLREEQDAAYIAALSIDEEKEKLKNSRRKNHEGKGKETTNTMITRTTHQHIETSSHKDDDIQVLIRFPNGERKEQTFSGRDKVQVIFGYIDSLGITGIVGNYRLISSFPKRVYGVEQMEMTLKDAGMHPSASLFLEFD